MIPSMTRPPRDLPAGIAVQGVALIESIRKHSSYYDADQFFELTDGFRHHFSILTLNIESINGSFHVK